MNNPMTEPTEPKSCTADVLRRLVFRLANQIPTRHWLDAKGDGSYSHVAIQIWLPRNELCEKLSESLLPYGFSQIPVDPFHEGPFVVRRWEAPRAYDKEGKPQ